MPTFEMPFAELEEYQGCNPRPADFDQYWDNAIQEMKAVDPCVTLVPSEFQAPFAECFDLYFTGVRQARIHAKYLRPKNFREPHPAVIQFHGYSCNSSDWSEKLNFVGAGFSVLAMDCRGQGGLSEDTGGVKGNTLHGHIIRGLDDAPENMLFRHIFLDTALLADIVMNLPEVDPNRVGVMGWSQGGGLTLACAALEPRIKRAGPCYPFLSDYRRVWEMDLAKDAYNEIRDYFRLFDPTHARADQVFTRLGYIDVQHLAGRIRGEVLFGTGLMDTVCPPSTQFAAYNKIKSPKQMEVYPDFTHEGLPGMNDKLFQFMMGL
jgi:cephalosporin-C deacetylase